MIPTVRLRAAAQIRLSYGWLPAIRGLPNVRI